MSTSLLNELMTDHLDGGYAAAAARKAERAERRAEILAGSGAGGVPGGATEASPGGTAGAATDVDGAGPGSSAAVVEAVEREVAGERRTAMVLLSVGLLLVGLLFAVAYRGTLRTAPESERARQALVRDVESGSALSDSLQRQAESLSGQLVKERDAVLTRTETGERVNSEVRRLEAAAAQVAVTGPGIKIIAGDALAKQQIDPSTGEAVSVPPDDNGRLRDRDLQSLVNALWAAGAEAISVGGERLAPTTTIRAAGEAILVDLRPVTSPYAIEAVGDPATLLPRFADSDAARRYQSYTGLYGIRFTVTRETGMTLRAGTGPDLRYAEPVPFAATPSGGGS